MREPVEHEGTADDARVTAELALPDAVTEDDHRGRLGPRLVERERASQGGPHAEH